MNKKGIIFTVTAVLMVVLLYAIYGKNTDVPEYYEAKSIDSRIKMMDNYVKNFELYTGDVIEMTAHDALNNLYDIRVSKRALYSDEDAFQEDFSSCVRCGKLNCYVPSNPCGAMDKNNMIYLLNNITSLAEQNLNIKTTYQINNIKASQSQPFEVEVTAYMHFTLEDPNAEYARWDKDFTVTRSISIVGFMDPYIGIINSSGVTTYNRSIIMSDVCVYNETCWNWTNVLRLYDTQAFRYFVNGTSYLQRWYWTEGLSPSSCCGLESFLDADMVDNKNTSYVDYHYYSESYDCPGGPKILEYPMIDDNFRLDDATAARYRISDIGNMVCQ